MAAKMTFYQMPSASCKTSPERSSKKWARRTEGTEFLSLGFVLTGDCLKLDGKAKGPGTIQPRLPEAIGPGRRFSANSSRFDDSIAMHLSVPKAACLARGLLIDSAWLLDEVFESCLASHERSYVG
jgi:hypothetical protein